MARKKQVELDPLAIDVIAAEQAGYGTHYGKYIADHGHAWKDEKTKITIPVRKPQVCAECGRVFYAKDNRPRKYCGEDCSDIVRERQLRESKKKHRELKTS